MKTKTKTLIVWVRMSPEEKQMLDTLTMQEGENNSATIRRLIRRAYLGYAPLHPMSHATPATRAQEQEKEA